MVIPMTLPQESKELLQPVDKSSQVSAEMAEASLKGIPTSISPITTVSRPESVTPPADPMELQGNANKTLKELLTTKASIDSHSWRGILETRYETSFEMNPKQLNLSKKPKLPPGNSKC